MKTITISENNAMQAKIALASILEAWNSEESLSHECILDILDDTQDAYKALCEALGVLPDYKC